MSGRGRLIKIIQDKQTGATPSNEAPPPSVSAAAAALPEPSVVPVIQTTPASPTVTVPPVTGVPEIRPRETSATRIVRLKTIFNQVSAV
jgi:hypothetical protein